MYSQAGSHDETPYYTSASLGSREEIQQESTLSYGHGNATVQRIFGEPSREKLFSSETYRQGAESRGDSNGAR